MKVVGRIFINIDFYGSLGWGTERMQGQKLVGLDEPGFIQYNLVMEG